MSDETKRKRILLADDWHLVRRGIWHILERESDFEMVGEADNGLEASD